MELTKSKQGVRILLLKKGGFVWKEKTLTHLFRNI